MHASFILYALVGGVALVLYRRLPVEVPDLGEHASKPLKESRGIVLKLAALFSLDAFGGGFVVQSLLALWLFDRFGLSLTTAAAIFFWTGRRCGSGGSEPAPYYRHRYYCGLYRCYWLIPRSGHAGGATTTWCGRDGLSTLDQGSKSATP